MKKTFIVIIALIVGLFSFSLPEAFAQSENEGSDLAIHGGPSPRAFYSDTFNLHGFYTHADDDSGSVQLTHTEDSPGHWRRDQTYALLVSPEGKNVDGISLDYDWADIESAPGTTNALGVTCAPYPNTKDCFDFSYFDTQLSALDAINKKHHRSYKAIISIIPSTFNGQPAYDKIGVQLPPWLFNQKGAKRFATLTNGYNPITGIYMANACLPVEIPLPWDPVFLTEYQKLIHAFAIYVEGASAKYPGMISAVKIIPLPYMNENTQLPNTMPTAQVQSCKNNHGASGFYAGGFPELSVPNDVQNWLDSGYTPEKLLNAYSQILGFYNTEFPNMPLELTVPGNALEPIDNQGIITDSQGVNIHTSYSSSTMLIQEASLILGKRLNISFHSLVGYRPNGFFAYLDGAGNGNISLGFGDGWLVSNDASCIMTGGFSSYPECTKSWAMRETFEQGQVGGANYMVLDLEDLETYKTFLTYAHDWIISRPGNLSLLLSLAQQHFNLLPWSSQNATILSAPSSIVAPNVALSVASDESAPPIQLLQETTANSTHGISGQFRLDQGHYAFTLFAAPYIYDNRWVKITIDRGTPHESSGVFYLDSKVVSSAPIAVDPTTGIGGPHAAEMACAQSNNRWCQLTLHFLASGGLTTIEIQLAEPPQGTQPYSLSYAGTLQAGVYLWGPQVVPLFEHPDNLTDNDSFTSETESN